MAANVLSKPVPRPSGVSAAPYSPNLDVCSCLGSATLPSRLSGVLIWRPCEMRLMMLTDETTWHTPVWFVMPLRTPQLPVDMAYLSPMEMRLWLKMSVMLMCLPEATALKI